MRCNLQIEGSGPRPEDVILDAGKGYTNPALPGAKPGGNAGCDNPDNCYTKHVVLRADRADGFVAKNLLTRGGREFGIYTEEIDGYLLDRTKFFWNADYGQLSFTSDHGLMRNCDGFGSGDSVVYPGAAPETGSQADTSFYPDAPRYNTVVKRCDLHGSALGYSGSMGNAVRITDNHIYGNVTGIASDTLSSAGHPGFPADYSRIDHNLHLLEQPRPLRRQPAGRAAGAGAARHRDHLRGHERRPRATQLHLRQLAQRDDADRRPRRPHLRRRGRGQRQPRDLVPGRARQRRLHLVRQPVLRQPHGPGRPPGSSSPRRVSLFGNDHSAGPGPHPNGTDFWWDEFSGNTGNCWFNNLGFDGTAGSITGPGAGAPPDLLPSNCDTSVGGGDPAKTAYLIDCSEGPDETGPLRLVGSGAAAGELRRRARGRRAQASLPQVRADRAGSRAARADEELRRL